MSAPLLVELGTEELPPKALARLSVAFAEGLAAALAEAHIDTGVPVPFATPRRLAVLLPDTAERQPDRHETRRGPAVSAAFDDSGAPTKAAQGFARSCGVDVAALGRVSEGDNEWLAFERDVPGEPLCALIGSAIERALAALPIPKRMRWGAREVEFVRPAHWLLVLHGAGVLDCEVLDLRAGRTTRGHRVHADGEITIEHADSYAQQLENAGRVIASFEARRERIGELIQAADTGGVPIIDDALLDEVTALVEWPCAVCGEFDRGFLELPPEVLVASMQDHQKYFPVADAGGTLVNRFVTIANLDSTDAGAVRHGNERVIRPRLADADFFWRSDRANPLGDRIDALDQVTFERRLGSLGDKTRRVAALARTLAAACGADDDVAARAAALSRCDLLTQMVGEFPELQGTMGAYYAAADGEPAAVATAIGEFYAPRFAGDAIPASAAGRCIALADKLDSLVGIFGIGAAPTGDKDPFALRRAALGALRIVTEAGIDLDLEQALNDAAAAYGDQLREADTPATVAQFMRERLRGYYLERGVSADVCTAVLAVAPLAPADIAARMQAVAGFRDLEAAGALAAANKRIGNILKKTGQTVATSWSAELLEEDAERDLAAALSAAASETAALFERRAYGDCLQRLAALRAPIDRFFDDVMVMSEDPALRNNRLAMLADLATQFRRIADIAELDQA